VIFLTFKIVKTAKFSEDMRILSAESQKKIEKKIEEMLLFDPYRYETLKGSVLIGIRKMRIGAKEFHNGVRILYAVCKDCKKSSHNLCGKLNECCDFSDEGVIKLLRLKPRDDETYNPKAVFA